MVIGVQKSGTSAMHYLLSKHPNIQMSSPKELHFFDKERYFIQDMPNYHLYESGFVESSEIQFFGESTPIYFYWKPCLERIKRYNPEVKFIVILRNPIARAFSQWNMNVLKRKEDRPFLKCIEEEMSQMVLGEYEQHRIRSYVSRGMYMSQLKRWHSHFKKPQILVLKYEDFRGFPENTLLQIFKFLNVDKSDYSFKSIQLNQSNYQSKIGLNEKQQLLEFFKKEILELQDYLGWDCSDWLEY